MDPKAPARSKSKEHEKMCVSCDENESGKDNKAKGWFLTYPQCPASPRSCLEDLEDKLKDKRGLKIVEYVICQEKHESGDPHLHAFIKLDKRIRFSKTLFDFIFDGKDYHGHYEAAKSWRAVKDYVVKDGNYISNIDIKNAMNGHAKKIGIKELEMDALDLLEKGIITGMQLNNFIKNQNLLLDPRNRQRKFFRTLGNFGDWTNTANAIDGAISIESSANGNKITQHSWTIKVSMYLLYKFSKA